MPRDLVKSIITGRERLKQKQEAHMASKAPIHKAVKENWPHVRIIVKGGAVQEVKCYGDVTYEVVDHDVR